MSGPTYPLDRIAGKVNVTYGISQGKPGTNEVWTGAKRREAREDNHMDGRQRSGPVDRDEVTGITEKQESFVQALAQTKDMLKAYKKVYDCKSLHTAGIYRKASELMDRPAVRKRLAEVMGIVGEGDAPAYGRLTERLVLERLKIEALDMKNPANVRVRALELLGKTNSIGLFSDVKSKDTAAPPNSKELEARLLAKLEELTRTKH